MDFTWIAQIAAAWVLLTPSAVAAAVTESASSFTAEKITAIGIIIGIMINGALAWKAASNSSDAKSQSKATALAVDGRMTEVVKLVGEKAAAEATLVEKAAREVRDAAVTLAVAPSVIAAAAKNGTGAAPPVKAKAKRKRAVKK